MVQREILSGREAAEVVVEEQKFLKSYSVRHFPSDEQLVKAKRGNISALRRWVGKVGFKECVRKLQGKEGITDPELVCGKLKGLAHKKGELKPEHKYVGRKKKDS